MTQPSPQDDAPDSSLRSGNSSNSSGWALQGGGVPAGPDSDGDVFWDVGSDSDGDDAGTTTTTTSTSAITTTTSTTTVGQMVSGMVSSGTRLVVDLFRRLSLQPDTAIADVPVTKWLELPGDIWLQILSPLEPLWVGRLAQANKFFLSFAREQGLPEAYDRDYYGGAGVVHVHTDAQLTAALRLKFRSHRLTPDHFIHPRPGLWGIAVHPGIPPTRLGDVASAHPHLRLALGPGVVARKITGGVLVVYPTACAEHITGGRIKVYTGGGVRGVYGGRIALQSDACVVADVLDGNVYTADGWFDFAPWDPADDGFDSSGPVWGGGDDD